MKRKDVFNTDVFNILSERYQQKRSQQRTNYAPYAQTPVPEPEPEKKSFWGRFCDKAKKIGGKIKDFCQEFKEVIAPITAAILSVTGLVGALNLNNNSGKKRPKKRKNKKSRKTGNTYYINIGTYLCVA